MEYTPMDIVVVSIMVSIMFVWMAVWAHYEIAVWTHDEIKQLNERYKVMTQRMHEQAGDIAKMETIDTMLKALDHKFTERMDTLEEMQFQLHEQHFTKTSEFEKDHEKRFADLDRQCDLYRKVTYHIFELDQEMVKLKHAVNKLAV